MKTSLLRLGAILKRLGLNGLDDIALSGQIIENCWHRSDCPKLGSYDSPIGPFPWAFLADKMTADCCANDLRGMTDELSPAWLTGAVNALLAIDQARQTVHVYSVDQSLTPFADLTPLDAAVAFQSELDEIVSMVASKLSRVHSAQVGCLNDDVAKLHQSVEELRSIRYYDPVFQSDLFAYVFEELGVAPIHHQVLTTLSPHAMSQPEDSMQNYLLHGLTITFALRAISERELTTMPAWAYQALRQLGGREWLSKPYSDLPASVAETAEALWDTRPECPMFDFDVCVEAALALQ
jgi:hypothetical protein